MNIKQIVGDSRRIAILPGRSLSAISSAHVLEGFLEQMHYQSKIFVPQSTEIGMPIPGVERHLSQPQVEQMVIRWPWGGESLESIQTEINQETKQVLVAVDTTGRNNFPTENEVAVEYQNWEPDMMFLLGEGADEQWKMMSFLESSRVVPWHEEMLLDTVIGLWTNQVWDIDQDLATHLLVLVDEQTDLLQKGKISPEVFELVSACIRAEGKRLMLDHRPKKSSNNSREQEPVNDASPQKSNESPNPEQHSPQGETKKSGYVIPDWLRAGVS